MSMLSRLLKQCRKPTGWLGRQVARGMNFSHARLTEWGLSHTTIERDFTILDIGCGGGETIHKLAGIANEGKVYGIDYSDDCVRISQNKNSRLIEAGRVDIRHGSVSVLPFGDNTFDLVTAVKTHYFWPNLSADLQEVRRVLKPGREVILIGGEYKGGKFDERNARWVEFGQMSYHTVEELREVLIHAGFCDVAVHEAYEQGWICALGRK